MNFFIFSCTCLLLLLVLTIDITFALRREDCKCRLSSNENPVEHESIDIASLTSAPWMASLGRPAGFNMFPASSHFCAAILLNERWALTSAQCVKYKRLQTIVIGIGSSDTGVMYTNGRLPIEKVIIHSAHAMDELAGNLALLKLGGEIKFNDTIQPACLDTRPKLPSGYPIREIDLMTMISWGTRKIVKTYAAQQTEATPNYSQYKETIEPPHICERRRALICVEVAQSENETKKMIPCYGDLGSPLTITREGKRQEKKVANLF